MLDKRAQGRPARGSATVGPKKIVEGMQEALRSLQTSNVTRKDIARFAGVTPALVTYYFPERDVLIEAATSPVIESLAVIIRQRLSQDVDPHSMLLHIIYDIVTCYSKNINIVELYIIHKKSAGDGVVQNTLEDVDRSITGFFDNWLLHFPDCLYSGRFLTNAMLGLCRAVAYHHSLDVDTDVRQDGTLVYARMIYRMLVGGLYGYALKDMAQDGSRAERGSVGQNLRPSSSFGITRASADMTIACDQIQHATPEIPLA